jgi:hypothetical protein
MVVVSSINSHNIQFIDIVRKNLCNEIHITGSDRGDVAASKTSLFVAGKGSIHVLNHQGHPVGKTKTKSENHTPLFITVCNSGSICYSDEMSLYCIKSDGEEVFTYNSPDLRNA